MGTSDYIALAALCISLLSVIYSKWSIKEAKRANDISLHAIKVNIYEEVVSFSDCFRGLLNVPTFERLQQFEKNALNLAEIYMGEEIFNQLNNIYHHCNNSRMLLSAIEEDDRPDIPSEYDILHEYAEALNMLIPVIEIIKQELKISNA